MGQSSAAELAGLAVAEHIAQVMFTDLGLRDCDDPEAAVELVREVLALMPTGMVMANRERLPQVCGSAGAAQFVLCALTDADLITHGGMLSGSWLEPKGEWLLAALGAYPDLSWHLRECACPHRDCGPCDADCWVIPSTWPPLPADATSALF